jgi:hypothetical protein
VKTSDNVIASCFLQPKLVNGDYQGLVNDHVPGVMLSHLHPINPKKRLLQKKTGLISKEIELNASGTTHQRSTG